MKRRVRGAVLWVIVVLVGTACTGASAPSSSDATGRTTLSSEPARTTKRLIAGIMGDPPTLRNTVHATGGTGSTPGLDTVEELISVGLTAVDNRSNLQPRLAETLPSIENGLWTVSPDGRMETIWKLRPGATWHDGADFTVQDLLFTATIGQDRDLAPFQDPIYDAVEGIDALDPHTLRVRWRKPYIDADRLFATQTATVPLPRHLLEDRYLTDKSAFTQIPYWGTDFVGTGPFRLREFVLGSHLILEANEHYFLGKPRIDEIEVRFIPDANALVASLLAGAVELSLGRNLSLDQAIQLRGDWKLGRVDAAPTNWIAIYPQFINPSPTVVGDARFRRALLLAIDRQTLGETLQGGLGSVAHSIELPEAPEYRVAEDAVVRYPYDPERAVQLIEQLGYTRGQDLLFRDGNGQALGVNLRYLELDLGFKNAQPVADWWRRIGINAETELVTSQRARDREYRATYPAFELVGNANNLSSLARIRASQAPIPENNFAGTNRARYVNPEFDGLLEQYFTTIILPQRIDVLAKIVHHMSDQVVWMGLYNRADPAMIGHRVDNVYPRRQDTTQGWNGHEWSLR